MEEKEPWMRENEEEKLSCKRAKWNYEMRKEDGRRGEIREGKNKNWKRISDEKSREKYRWKGEKCECLFKM